MTGNFKAERGSLASNHLHVSRNNLNMEKGSGNFLGSGESKRNKERGILHLSFTLKIFMVGTGETER